MIDIPASLLAPLGVGVASIAALGVSKLTGKSSSFGNLTSGAFSKLLKIHSSALMSISPIRKAINGLIVSRFPDDVALRIFDEKFKHSEDLLLQGSEASRRRYAQERYGRYKLLFIPLAKRSPDLARSMIIDDQVYTGDPVEKLCEGFIGEKHHGVAFRDGARAALLTAIFMLTSCHPGLITKLIEQANSQARVEQAMQSAGDGKALVSMVKGDHWDTNEYMQAIERTKLSVVGPVTQASIGRLYLTDFLEPSLWLAAFCAAMWMGLSAYTGTIRGALNATADGFPDFRKAGVRRRSREDEIDTEIEAREAQAARDINYDRSPKIFIGQATGNFLFRGVLGAPSRGQDVYASLLDLLIPMLGIGGTGSGKTSVLIKNHLKQILDYRIQFQDEAVAMRVARGLSPTLPPTTSRSQRSSKHFEWPFGIQPDFVNYEKIIYPRIISTFVMDAKAVLPDDCIPMAKARGLKLRIIGPKQHLGEYSVDLCDGQTPLTIANNLKSGVNQASGGQAGNDIWPKMASVVIYHCLVILRAFEMTPEGISWIDEHQGERPYSFVGALQLCSDNGPLLLQMLQAIDRCDSDPALRPLIAQYMGPDFYDSVNYMVNQWGTLYQATKDGILINVVDALGGFASHPELRSTFGSGGGVNLMSIDELWGSFCATRISTIEYGVAGRITNIMIKTLFQSEAVRRQVINKQTITQLESEFFDLFPAFSERALTLEEIGRKLNAAAKRNEAAFDLYEQLEGAFENHERALREALLDAGEILPQSSGDEQIRLMTAQLLSLPDGVISESVHQNIEASRRTHQNLHQAFAQTYPKLAREKVMLEQHTHLNPFKFRERIEHNARFGDASILKHAQSVDPSLTDLESVIQKCHEIYYMWDVETTKLAGVGEGNVREILFNIIDECQAIVTVDREEAAMSDSNFSNISRSTGVAPLYSTQSYAALKLALGQDAAANFCEQMRNRFILANEEDACLEMIEKSAGEVLSSHIFDDTYFESYETARRHKAKHNPGSLMAEDMSLRPLASTPIFENEDASVDAGLLMAFENPQALSATSVINNSFALKTDRRFIPPEILTRNQHGAIEQNTAAIQQATSGAVWRAEDKAEKRLTEGFEKRKVFPRTMLQQSGGANHAFVMIQRAGKVTMDIVKIGSDVSETRSNA